jgi:hypothetical protein
LTKRSKELLVLGAVARGVPTPAGAEVFLLLFFQKKKRLLLGSGVAIDLSFATDGAALDCFVGCAASQ